VWWLGASWQTLFAWVLIGGLGALAATAVVERWHRPAVFLALGVWALTLILGAWLQGARETVELPLWLGLAAAAFPVFVGAFLPPALLREHTAAPSAIAWGLLGVCVGGLLEHMVLRLGLQSRALFAILALAAAYGCFYAQKRRGKKPSGHRGGGRMFLKKAVSGR